MDPFVDLIRLLRPQATLWRRVEARGNWGISFPAMNDVLFCWVASGECFLDMSPANPVKMRTNDFALVKTSSPFNLCSEVGTAITKSESLFTNAKTVSVKVGAGQKRPVTIFGGTFVFESANADLLTGLLPPVLHVPASARSHLPLHNLLEMNSRESLQPRAGSDYVIVRLMELILIETLRSQSELNVSRSPGLLAGLNDDVIAPALVAMHSDITKNWTVNSLAKIACTSRTAFANRFREIVGVGPINYLFNWRMAVAKDELHKGEKSVGEIALQTGFQSTSAFSTAFKRSVGQSPASYKIGL